MNETLAACPSEIDGAGEEQLIALVVDDAAVDRMMAARQVAAVGGLRVVPASGGAEALASARRERPAVVLTDLQMPGVDGLELVEMLRAEMPEVPVILMTAAGSEETAVAALRAGAAHYIPKRRLAVDLPFILPQVLSASKAERRRRRFLECVTRLECRLALESDASLVPPLVAHIQEHVLRMGLVEGNGRIRVGVALEEALLNGLYHGNLELDSRLRQDGGDAFERLAAQRRRQAPYAERRLHVHVNLGPEEARVVIRDEGPGFDPRSLPDPTDPENLLKASGRGLLLIRTFMDDVSHNATGNEITLVKRRAPRRAR